MTSNESVAAKLEVARRELLDLTARNRLLNTQRSSSRSSRLEIVDELSAEVFRHLVQEGKSMTFLPRLEEPAGLPESEAASPTTVERFETSDDVDRQRPDEPVEAQTPTAPSSPADSLTAPSDFDSVPPLLGQPDELEGEGAEGPDPRHVDNQLQTELPSELLQKRLLKLYYDARTYEEEQGVNILFLALGFLKWREPERSDRDRYAPLILVPVTLSRKNARAKFRLRYDDEEITTNLSLQEKLKVDRQIRLPDLPDAEDLSPDDYFDQVEDLIRDFDGWEVLRNDIVLWFFSFSRFLMYRDLQSENWPAHRAVDQHLLVSSLLTTGFPAAAPLCGEEDPVDPLLDPAKTLHVTDADSSQALAIEESRLGRNLVIQGPPGTGKSQTITNLIAAAVCEGRRVLFVAEKMAALEVVKRRLDALGVGNACLELHSHKASKRAVLAELDETLRLGRPRQVDVEKPAAELGQLREQLNEHAEKMCLPILPTELSPFDIIGEFTALRDAGVAAPDFSLDGCAEWTRQEFEARIELLEEIRTHLAPIGVPDQHAWRGVEVEGVIPTDRDRLINQSSRTHATIVELTRRAQDLAGLLRQDEPVSFTDVTDLQRVATSFCEAPELDAEAISKDAWHDRNSDIEALVECGTRATLLREQLQESLIPLAFSTDVSSVRIAIAAHGQSWFRIFIGDYRRAVSTFKGLAQEALPGAFEDRLQLLDDLIECQQCEKQIEKADSAELGREVFGKLWRGLSSDWTSLSAILDWDRSHADLNGRHRSVASLPLEKDTVRQALDELVVQRNDAESQLTELFVALQLEADSAFERPDWRNVAIEDLTQRLTDWSEQPEALSLWIAFRQRHKRLVEYGLSELGRRISDGRIGPSAIIDSFRMARCERLVRLIFETHPELNTFTGLSHEQLIDRFRKLDMDHMLLARRRLARIHHDRMPRQASNIGQIGIIRREIQKKRSHLPLRRLFAQAGRAVQAIKPVFMMSPTSIAQFLEPGGLTFEMLVVDEASQIPPVDALGAIARCQQIVVVGDDRQLPPTRFFQRMVDDDDTTDAAELHAGHMESILSLCAAQNVTQRMLRWHYRSRHHSLIAVSNQEFYRGQLRVIPSPEAHSDALGLKFHFVEDGVFDRGGSATNRTEARAVVRAVMQHALQYPTRSLGVGTFSVSQRDAILDELEFERRQHPETESFFSTDGYEPFFVKNLENVQGDERDMIFISIGYAKDADGKLSMNFGPLSNEGGERRLNVLITRARSRCEVFSSIRAEQIDLNRTRARGTQALKTFLGFAESGELSEEDPVTSQSTVLAQRVADSLAERGYQVRQRIGMSGLFVDLGIVDPENPDRCLVGIEFDGPDYQTARSARDRDRTRPTVLQLHGWRLERIWGIDWLHRPQEQIDRLMSAAVDVKTSDTKDHQEPDADETKSKVQPAGPSGIERSDSPASDGESVTRRYEESTAKAEEQRRIQDLSNAELSRSLVTILKREAPIHIEELSRRMASMYGQKRTSRQITESIQEALTALSQAGRVEHEDSFFTLCDQEIRVRDRSRADATIRRPEMLPPQEMRAAVRMILELHFGATRNEAVVETARRFGFRSTSSVLRERIESIIDDMLASGQLEEHDGWLHVTDEPGSENW